MSDFDISRYSLTEEEREYGASLLKDAMESSRGKPGFIGKVGNSLAAMGSGLANIPRGVAETVSSVRRAGDIDVTDPELLEDLENQEQARQEYMSRYGDKAFSGIPEAMQSMPYSLTTMGGSVLGGAVGGLAGPVSGAAGGMATSGTLAYRGTRDDFMKQVLFASKHALGRYPTQDEWRGISDGVDDEANKYGGWEAVPEAVTNALFLKFIGPAGRALAGNLGLKSIVGRGAFQFAGAHAEEQIGETVTNWGQGGVEARVGLRDEAPTVSEAFKEQAPATFWQTTLMGGAAKSAQWGYDRLTRPKTETEKGLDALLGGKDEAETLRKAQALPPGSGEALPPRPKYILGYGQHGRGSYSHRRSGSSPFRRQWRCSVFADDGHVQ